MDVHKSFLYPDVTEMSLTSHLDSELLKVIFFPFLGVYAIDSAADFINDFLL